MHEQLAASLPNNTGRSALIAEGTEEHRQEMDQSAKYFY